MPHLRIHTSELSVSMAMKSNVIDTMATAPTELKSCKDKSPLDDTETPKKVS